MATRLLTEIEKPLLDRLLKSLYYCTDLPISALDEKGLSVCTYGEMISFCQAFKALALKGKNPKDSCENLHRQAAIRCMKQGEAFIFTCHADLNHIIFPLCDGMTLYGTILVGPFLIYPLSDEMLTDIAQRYSLNPSETIKLEHESSSIPIICSEKADQISLLLSAVFDPIIHREPEGRKATADNERDDSVESRAVRKFISKSYKNSNQIVQKAVSYIAENYKRHITLEDVADHLGMNPSYISTLFKQSYGVSYREFLNMTRVEAAKALLRGTDNSIVDISAETSFEDQSYFTKVFKRYTGMTPKQYRAKKE